MADARPLLLLDIDGALSPYATPEGFETEQIFGFRMALHPQLRSWLRELDQLYELVWATTWGKDANVHFGPAVGLPALEWIRFGPDSNLEISAGLQASWQDGEATRKLFYIESWLEQSGNRDRPLAWLEDDLLPDALRWAHERAENSAATLICHTDRDLGLEPGHFRQLVEFATSDR